MQRNLTLGRTRNKFNQTGQLRPMTENPDATKMVGQTEEEHDKSFFAKTARCCTISFCCTDSLLVPFVDPDTRNEKKVQDWREKVTICIVFAGIMAFVVFFAVGLQPVLCPPTAQPLDQLPNADEFVSVFGYGYRISDNPELANIDDTFSAFSKESLQEMLFPGACQGLTDPVSSLNLDGLCDECIDMATLNPNLSEDSVPESFVTYQEVLEDTDRFPNHFILNGNVLDMAFYLQNAGSGIVHDLVTKYTSTLRGQDATLEFTRLGLDQEVQCLTKYRVIGVEKQGPGCFISGVITILALIAVLGIILSRFFMAIYFSWIIEPRLLVKGGATPPLTILVTCYNEDEQGLRQTLDSIDNCTYPSKMVFLVCDGIGIKGKTAPAPTSEIATSLIQVHQQGQPMDYFSIEQGNKQHNRAIITTGHYNNLPLVICVKAGNPREEGARRGNRGKRDSQMILMNFFSHCFYDDRMTPLEMDMYHKIYQLIGVLPEEMEYLLMVDADTVLEVDALDCLIGAMKQDPMIMGMCGETRVVNTSASWVTKIQVFEYYISHHMAKAFESAFGGVTCLPGCFCMYRIKAPYKGGWVPILSHRDIVQQYAKTDVHTLHERNLLLLGEDRFLTTLMLRNFPKRKQIFVPSARCYTEVPDTFSVLLDQRRRWINSTLHNLFELIFVNQLCGILCCSMQFVVALEVFGTISLPVAVVLTYFLIIDTIVRSLEGDYLIRQFTTLSPLILFLLVLFLPGLLVMLTRREWQYLGWMFYYLVVGLPIWNFVLPVYAYWKMDEFSWGKTRAVEGGEGEHGSGAGQFDPRSIETKRMKEWLMTSPQVGQGQRYEMR